MNKPPVGPPPGWGQPQPPPQYSPPPVTIVNQVTVASHSSATAVASARSGGNPVYGCLGCLLMFVLIPMLCGGGCLVISAIGGNAARQIELEAAKEKRELPVVKQASITEPVVLSADPPSLPKSLFPDGDVPAPGSPPPPSPLENVEPAAVLKNLPLRDWTSTIGSAISARLVSCKDGKVSLKKKDGTIVELRLDQLSDGDQKYVRQSSRYDKR